jgi:hypothetical protein
MPFVALVVLAFALGIIWNRGPSRQLYVLFLIGGAIATIYFMR